MGAKKGHIVSEETRRKISIANTGKKRSEATRQKMSAAKKGKPSVNKGRHLSEEHRSLLSESHKGKVGWNKGKKLKPLSEEHRKKISEALKGEKSRNWKGGITPENKIIRRSIEVRLWRAAVYARDNWTCQKCEIKGGSLHPHHINNFAEFPELRTSIENGITLCKQCHSDFHKEYGYRNNIMEQLNDFIRG